MPGLAVHLLPLRSGIEHGGHGAILDRLARGRVRRTWFQIGGGRDEPAIVARIEELLAVERHFIGRQIAEHLFGQALVHRESPQRNDRRPVFLGWTAHRKTFGEKQHAGLADGQIDIVARGNRQQKNPIADSGQIDHGRLGLFGALLLALVLVVLGSRLTLVLVVLALVLLGIVFLGVIFLGVFFLGVVVLFLVLIVALRGDRRGAVARQHHDINAAIGGAVERGQVDSGNRWTVIRRGREVQGLATGIENRIRRIAHAVRDLRGGMSGDRIEKYGVHLAFEIAGIRNPLRVGRPRERRR